MYFPHLAPLWIIADRVFARRATEHRLTAERRVPPRRKTARPGGRRAAMAQESCGRACRHPGSPARCVGISTLRFACLLRDGESCTRAAHPLACVRNITRALKGITAQAGNRILRRTGQRFWQDESFDHWVRSEGEFIRIQKYIENNPVKAGLVAKAEDWPWSSARK